MGICYKAGAFFILGGLISRKIQNRQAAWKGDSHFAGWDDFYFQDGSWGQGGTL